MLGEERKFLVSNNKRRKGLSSILCVFMVTIGIIIVLYTLRHPVHSSLVAYWTMDGNDLDLATGEIRDQSGNGNNARVAGRAPAVALVSGHLGEALKFDGVAYLMVPDSQTLRTPASITISAWIKPSTSEDADLIEKVSASGDGCQPDTRGFAFELVSSKLFFIIGDSNTSAFIARYAIVAPNKWSHIVGVWNGGTTPKAITIYVDGEASSTEYGASNITNVCNTDGPLFIGASPGVNYFDGLVDDVRIYNRALSASEAQEL